MDYIAEFRDGRLCSSIAEEIGKECNRDMRIMEVCGTHTMSIHRYGIKSMLPKGIKLLSGPGCPVCVTSSRDINGMIACSKLKGTIIATFGDMLRVPGSDSSLEKERARGADVRIVYSPMDAVQLAENTDKRVIFLGVGFETTAPTVAQAIKEAPENFFVYSAHKVVPPALRVLLEGDNRIDGFLLPGHVCTVTGTEGYEFVPREYKVPCVVSGFEPVDILASILMLVRQEGKAEVEIEYKRSVRREGNPKAIKVMREVFETCDSVWRGIGAIKNSGLRIREEFRDRDIRDMVEVPETREPEGCRCGEVLQGLIEPTECALFSNGCTPDEPVGPCMVSSEGTCAAYYKYGGYS
jgi:hydrogenase expression/formation protein HypD